MKRIALFILTNIAVMTVLTIIINLFGLSGQTFDASGNIQYLDVLILSGVIGFGGAIISLMMSKQMAKWSTGATIIKSPRNETERWLLQTVERQARTANIGMPDVAIFDSSSPNAFATGMSKNNALVAVSSGLLQRMNRDQVEAVLGHEVAHVANGDMVTLTLIQGVVNTFVIFAARIIGSLIDRAVFKNERGHGIGYFMTVTVLQIVFGILASVIVMWFSRHREFHADQGGAALSSTDKMISALEALKGGQSSDLPEQMAAFGIKPGPSKLGSLFMSHPPLDSRIEALQKAKLHIG